MNAIMRAFRLDMRRFNSQGRYMLLFFTAVMPVIMVAMTLLMNGMAVGAAAAVVNGAFYGVFAVIPFYVFIYENQSGAGRLNGIIPVSRAHQVTARYLFMLAATVLFCLDFTVYTFVMNLLGHTALWSAGDTRTIAGTFVGYLVFESILYPLLYRFPAQRALVVICGAVFVGSMGIVALMLALVTLLGEARVNAFLDAVVAPVIDALAADANMAAVLAVVAALVVCAVSFVVSVRFYSGKEL